MNAAAPGFGRTLPSAERVVCHDVDPPTTELLAVGTGKREIRYHPGLPQ